MFERRDAFKHLNANKSAISSQGRAVEASFLVKPCSRTQYGHPLHPMMVSTVAKSQSPLTLSTTTKAHGAPWCRRDNALCNPTRRWSIRFQPALTLWMLLQPIPTVLIQLYHELHSVSLWLFRVLMPFLVLIPLTNVYFSHHRLLEQ